MAAVFDDLIAHALRAGELAAASGDITPARELAQRYRLLVREGPEGEPRAAALARATVAQLERGVLPRHLEHQP